MLRLLGIIASFIYVVKLLWSIPGCTSRRRSLKQTFGRTVLLTGATDGIGRALAFKFATQKGGVQRLIICGRDQTKLDNLKTELVNASQKEKENNKTPVIVETLKHDFNEDRNYDALVQDIKERRPDSLVNCAGISYPSALYFHELPVEFIDKMINVNLITPLVVSSAVMKSKYQNKSLDNGTIVLLGSASSIIEEPLLAAYAGTKAALDGFGTILATEQQGGLVGVQVQLPLMIATRMSKIRKASMAVPSATHYADLCINSARYAANTSINNHMNSAVCPYYPHLLMLIAAALMPKFFLERLRMSEQKHIRSRYLAKNNGMVVCV